MRGANRFSAGLLRFAVIVCAFALISLFLAFGWNTAWIAVQFYLEILLCAAPFAAVGSPAPASAGLPRLPFPRAPPSA